MSDKNVNKVIYDGETLVDLTKDTVTPQLLAEGATAHNASGEAIVGVAPTTAVLYTPQSLSDTQKKQARENIDAEPLVFEITFDPEEGASPYPDGVSYWDLAGAYELGRTIICKLAMDDSYLQCPLIANMEGVFLFGVFADAYVAVMALPEGVGYQLIDLVTFDFLPTELPNPNALTFTGAVSGTYDGSEAKTINIPTIAGPTGPTGPAGANGVSITSVKQTTTSTADDGNNVITVTLSNGQTSTFTVQNGSRGSTGAKGDKGDTGPAGSDANVTKTNVINALGYTPANKAFEYPTPQDYGAKGNGSTDDTTAFRNALANNRVVYVPGGTYKLSGELLIRGNCQLKLSQDAVLLFTQTTGNCITMDMCAWIKGNHATVSVPYAFTGNVINIDTGTTADIAAQRAIPPFTHWDPVWKPGRYINDLNIVKPNAHGLYYSTSGECSGTAIYIFADGNDVSTFLWGVDLSGLRIAGAFTYGIYSEVTNVNGGDGWNHDMKLNGLIAGCETGVKLIGTDKVYLETLVQPQRDEAGNPYAKVGIYLENSKYTNILNGRTFDWNSYFTLWADGNQNQHLVMIGDCTGTVFEDWNYYAFNGYDIRDLIYTDNQRNIDTLTFAQEPITRWFKPIDHMPYFYDGSLTRKLVLDEEFKECIVSERIANFTNVLPTAKDSSGNIYNGKGYVVSGTSLNFGSGGTMTTDYYGCTGFIPVVKGNIIYTQGLELNINDSITGVILYDSSFAKVTSATGVQLGAGTVSYYFSYEEVEAGFKLTINAGATVAYMRLSFSRGGISDNPIISIGKPITYTQSGYLADGIMVNPESVTGLSEMLGSYINDVDALIGG